MKLLLCLSLLPLMFSTAWANSLTRDVVIEQIQHSIQQKYQLSGTKTETYTVKVGKSPSEQKMDRLKLEQQKKLGLPTDRVLSGEERVELLLAKKRGELQKKQKQPSKEASWFDSMKSNLNDWFESKKSQHDNWVNEKKKLLESWAKAKQAYQKNIPQYKKTVAAMNDEVEAKKFTPQKTVTKTRVIQTPLFGSAHVIPEAFASTVKNQGFRPTCAAFAGVRAIEILARRKAISRPLSEQYFYWASKGQCQRSPCAKRGSWPSAGFRHSQKQSGADIPSSQDCPYQVLEEKNNQTQIPLKTGCQKGLVQVQQFSKAKTLKQVRDALDANFPVIAGVTLSENFYTNNGYVFFQESQGISSRDQHAEGHAILLVGHMELPADLAGLEGRYCFLTANSWGEGWGVGGHTCLSEKWIQKHKLAMDYLVLESISP
jgi:hypothetical protein